MQVLVALDYIHRKLEIIHTDLKPENIMLSVTVREPKRSMPASSAVKHSGAAPNGEKVPLPAGLCISAFVIAAFSCLVVRHNERPQALS